MSRARIVEGTWTRKVPWKQNGDWRTDIFKSVLSDPRLRQCCFVLGGGPTVCISASELRRVLEGGSDHYDGRIWGPFNINPLCNTVAGQKVQMQLV